MSDNLTMGTSVLHIKTEVECKVFLFDEEKGIATTDKYFNLEVRKGEQDLLFVSIEDETKQYATIYYVEENDCDYKIIIEESSFVVTTKASSVMPSELLYAEVTNKEICEGIEDDFGVVYSKDYSQLLRCNNRNISSYCVNENCKIIRRSAFFGTKLNNITLPDGLTYIGCSVFVDCDNLSSITLPISLSQIGDSVFCFSNIKTVYSKSPNFVIKNGCLIDVINRKLIAFLSDVECLELPPSITHIGDGAFCNCKNLTSITISNGLTHIGDSAFFYCQKLSTINLPSSLKHIGERAFLGCNNLTSIAFPNGLTHIGVEAFSRCTRLKSITLPNGLTQISEHTFNECEMLTNVILPEGLTHINNHAFSSCKNLTSISFPESLTHIVVAAFFDCCNLSNINLPDGLTHIDDKAFYECMSISTIALPKGLTYIGVAAFYLTQIRSIVCKTPKFIFLNGCLIDSKEKRIIAFLSDDDSIEIPLGITHIGKEAFCNCENITNLTLPSGLTHIEEEAFSGCENISSITLPNSLTHIGNFAFYACNKLTNITIPLGVINIGVGAFCECKNLSIITLPNSLSYIGVDAFNSCERLSSIIIQDGMKEHFERLLPKELHNLLEEKSEESVAETTQKLSCYLFFDTETTGIPQNYNAPASNTNNWPRLVQLGWILTDESGNEISSGNEIIKPEGFVIPVDASRVHGITTEVALREGKPLEQVLQSFLKDAEGIKCFVGHNVSFDQKVIGAELYRLGIADTVSSSRSLDTMIAATDFCKIHGTYGYKWPKLIELHRKLFGCDFEDAHDAMADITATKKCFFEMRRRKLI